MEVISKGRKDKRLLKATEILNSVPLPATLLSMKLRRPEQTQNHTS